MLSILIPVYNYDITELVYCLHLQATELNIKFEIIIIEDGSTDYLYTNKQLSSLENVKYYVLDTNVGRSCIRNILADKAEYPYLLFLDNDSKLCNNHFLKKYIDSISENCVINGGITYDQPFVDDNKYALRVKYTIREIKTAKERYHSKLSFTTFNLLIDKQVFTNIRFNESIKGYGYEDLIFAYMLLDKGYKISHIDNPVIHTGLDESHTFLCKTHEAIRNLHTIYFSGDYPLLPQYSKILSWYSFICKYQLKSFINFAFKNFKTPFIRNLLSSSPSLFIYDLYKLGLMCSIN